MKGAIGIALAFALMLSIAPGRAEDTFHAFSIMPAAQQSSLAPLLDEQLAAVQGKEMFLISLPSADLLSIWFDPAIIASSVTWQIDTMGTQSFSHMEQTTIEQTTMGGGTQTINAEQH
jgi:hypothetical protein